MLQDDTEGVVIVIYLHVGQAIIVFHNARTRTSFGDPASLGPNELF